MIDNRAMPTAPVVIELKNPLSLGSQAYGMESHALTNSGQVQYITIRTCEQQPVFLQETNQTLA